VIFSPETAVLQPCNEELVALPVEATTKEASPRASYDTFVIHDEMDNGKVRSREYWFSVFNGGADDPDEDEDSSIDGDNDDDDDIESLQLQPLSTGGESSTSSKRYSYVQTLPPRFDDDDYHDEDPHIDLTDNEAWRQQREEYAEVRRHK